MIIVARCTARILLFLNGLEIGIIGSSPSLVVCEYRPFFSCRVSDLILRSDALNSEIKLINECHL